MCVVLRLPFQFIHVSFLLSLSHVSLSQAHLLSMSACLSLCVCLHVFRICRRISRLFSYTLCGVRYALFVCFLSAIVAPSIYWAIFLSVCAMKTIWNALSRFVRANILWRPYLICVSLYWFFFLSSTSSSSSSAFLFFCEIRCELTTSQCDTYCSLCGYAWTMFQI